MTDLLASLGLNDAVAVINRIPAVLFILDVLFLVYTYRACRTVWLRAVTVPLFIQIGHQLFGVYLFIDVFFTTHDYFAKFAPFQVPVGFFGFIYAFAVWELGNFLFHWTCHRVRFLWSFHAVHHTSEHLNVTVGGAMFFYEATYSVFVRVAVCTVLGVPLPLLLLSLAVDGLWGTAIHISEEAWKSGRLPGFLGRVLLCPAHHRLHHASNPQYLNKNYCNLLPVWDKLFGTFQEEIKGVVPRYGLRRPTQPGIHHFYFGELVLLIGDVAKARSLKDAILYVVMPPGWRPDQKRVKAAARPTP